MCHEQSTCVCVREAEKCAASDKSRHHHLPATVSCMADQGNAEMPVFMRRVLSSSRAIGFCIAIGVLSSSFAQAAVNVYAPAELQSQFIASTTNQYESTLVPSPYFPGTYTLTIKAKKQDPVPPPKPINDATAFDQCMAYGFVDGMLWEREYMKRDFDALKSDILVTKTCGGYTMTQSTTIPTNLAYLSGCMMGYNVAESTMTARNGLPPFFDK